MDEEDLEIRDDRDYTALEYAAITGSVEAAMVLINKNGRLPNLLDAGGDCPLCNAIIQSGFVSNSDMIWYLASMTTNEEVFSTNLVRALVITGYVGKYCDYIFFKFSLKLCYIKSSTVIYYLIVTKA